MGQIAKTPTLTLEQACRVTYEKRWRNCRNGGLSIKSQADAAVRDLTGLYGQLIVIDEVNDEKLRGVVSSWYAKGLSPATINKRLNCLSAMGVTVQGYRQKIKPSLKWWLRPEEERRAVQWLTVVGPLSFMGTGRGPDPANGPFVLANLILWTTRTGLRIEESLRLTWSQSFNHDRSSVLVPGLKTATSQASLPLSEPVTAILDAIHEGQYEGEDSVFPCSYEVLERVWGKLREAMRWEGNGVTMKALRRSAARFLHVDCGMPLDMVRHYLRHDDLDTTMGYLRLTGGYDEEEMRRYLR